MRNVPHSAWESIPVSKFTFMMSKKLIKSLEDLKGRAMSCTETKKLKGGNTDSTDAKDDDTIITQDVVEI